MAAHDIVVVGFSAGGIDPFLHLVQDLPRDFPASLFVVHHFPAHSISALPAIVSRATVLPAAQATDGDRIVPGRIYLARPDHHLLLRPGRVRLTRGPREHGHRPAVDPLFRTAARNFGPRVIGVVLSGTLDDGTAGLHAIKAAGGITVVQEPQQSAYSGMPSSALRNVAIDHVVPPEALGALIGRLVRESAGDAPHVVSRAEEIDPADPEPAVAGTARLREDEFAGRPSFLTCPDCGGVLYESENGDMLHFRCHVGHAYSQESLLAKQSDALESALWGALRALEEKADLTRRLVDRLRRRGAASERTIRQFEETARQAEHSSNMIRGSLLSGPFRHALEGAAEPAPEQTEEVGSPSPKVQSG